MENKMAKNTVDVSRIKPDEGRVFFIGTDVLDDGDFERLVSNGPYAANLLLGEGEAMLWLPNGDPEDDLRTEYREKWGFISERFLEVAWGAHERGYHYIHLNDEIGTTVEPATAPPILKRWRVVKTMDMPCVAEVEVRTDSADSALVLGKAQLEEVKCEPTGFTYDNVDWSVEEVAHE